MDRHPGTTPVPRPGANWTYPPLSFHHELPSQASLDDSPVFLQRDLDDQAHLTSENYGRDTGRVSRYNEPISPLRSNRTFKAMSRNLRRVSVRVVNLAGLGLDDQLVRIPDATDEDRSQGNEDQDLPDLMVRPPLRGVTLMIFGPTNPVRVAMYKLLLWPWTEPIIFLLIFANAVILAIQSRLSVLTKKPPPVGYFHEWEDFALFILFVLFTLESIARMIVSGLILDPETKATSWRLSITSFQSTQDNRKWFGDAANPSTMTPSPESRNEKPSFQPSLSTSDSQHSLLPLRARKPTVSRTPFRSAVEKQRSLAEQSRPYLRHSWNRIDFLAVTSFWVMFTLATLGLEKTTSLHLSLFRALSVLRTTRLLAVTSGTTTIMRSLKQATPLLVNVAYFLVFAIVLFSIIGVQSFKGSFRRQCILQLPDAVDIPLGQPCGRYIDPITLAEMPYLDAAEQPTAQNNKGFICPLGQICRELKANPHEGIQSFDDVFRAALQILIITGANQWSPVMYNMIDSDFFLSALFFITCLVVLNFWLLNLFVAVITNTFSVIRSQTKRSAFGAAAPGPALDEQDEGWTVVEGNHIRSTSSNRLWYQRSLPLWIVLAFFSLLIQALKPESRAHLLTKYSDWIEFGITMAFDIEILWRISTYLPNWRAFGMKTNNWLDLSLAVGSTIIQLPVIKHSPAYPWLTILQLARFYRVILIIPRMRPLLLAVFGNMYGLANMSLFLILINFLAALVAVQLFRGDFADDNNINFSQLFNGFLGMYQIFSSENWTDVLYSAVEAESRYRQQLVSVLFIVGWFFFANFIMLQMFIAVINENFAVAEEQKRAQQVQAYIRKAEPVSARASWIDRFNPYRWLHAKPKAIAVNAMPSNLVLPIKKSVVQDYLAPNLDANKPNQAFGINDAAFQGWLGTGRRLVGIDQKPESVPLTHLKARRDSALHEFQDDDDHERQLDILASTVQEATVQDATDALFEQRARKADFIAAHPTYDKSLWLLSQRNPLRRWCQKLVPPSNGERIFGVPPSPIPEFVFRAVMILTVIAGIVVAAVANPVYRKQFYVNAGGPFRGAWFDLAETAFGLVLIVEFLIKVIADGFVFTPNAYLLSIWNVVDLAILSCLLVNMITTLIFIGGLSRGTRALKAVRALRLITLLGTMRETFHSVLFAGAARILDAAMLALLYMIPYAVWGLNIFSGALLSCNDQSVKGKGDCQNEFIANPVDNSLGFLAPRVWDNPTAGSVYSFDTFGSSLLILFEIVSLEGWIDVLFAAMGVTGRDQQPRGNSSPGNALFFLIYNLLGGVVILTLFVSIIIANFSSRSGMALLTAEQRQWIDLKKFLDRQQPSKLPKQRPTGRFRAWCFDRAVQKHGWWSRSMTILYVGHIIMLMTQTFDSTALADHARDFFFLGIAAIYLGDIVVRLTGLGRQAFWSSGWNQFDVFVVLGTFATTVPIIAGSNGFIIRQLQKLFLVSIAFKLVQKTNSLNQLFKTAAASISVIINLFMLWLTLFLFFAILFIEVFSMTKWGRAETHAQNYVGIGNALVMLAFMSTGEGWNGYMHDYALIYPRCTDPSPNQPESDCGSVGWAFVLFISWNILSMYIFVNMFTGVVVENFSYVIQRGTSSVTREEMRAFKKVWAEFDKARTGFITPSKYTAFFSKLTGVFEVRIYPAEYGIIPITQVAKRTDSDLDPGQIIDGIVVSRLEKCLSGLDASAIRARRRTYNRLYHEARLTGNPERGLSFNQMLLLLAHYKIIDDSNALVVDDLLKRKVIKDEVTASVNLAKVKSLLRMIYHRRRTRLLMETHARVKHSKAQNIPAIVVGDCLASGRSQPTTPIKSRDITLANRDSLLTEPDSPASHVVFDLSGEPSSPRIGRRARISDISMLSGEMALQSREASPSRESHLFEDPQHIISSLNGSLWGDMMLEAAENEEQ